MLENSELLKLLSGLHECQSIRPGAPSAAGRGLIDKATLRTVNAFARRLQGLSREQLDALDHALNLLSNALFPAATNSLAGAAVSRAEFP